MKEARKYTNILLSIFCFFLTANTLFPIPLDKVLLLFAVTFSFIAGTNKSFINLKYILICFLILGIAILGEVVNRTFSPMLFYPVIGVLFIASNQSNSLLLISMYRALAFHIFIALVLYVTSYFYMNDHVRTMFDKGLPFLHASLGFTSTNQTFGTYCVLWIILYYYLKDNRAIRGPKHRLLFVVAVIAIITTLNRSTILFFLLVCLFKNKKIIFATASFVIGLVIVFFDEIMSFLLNSSSLDSREELLEGFNNAFWGSNSVLIYLFGRGSVFLSDDDVFGTTWEYRNDVENGYAFILHAYGFLGLFIYLCIVCIILFHLMKQKRIFEFTILFFYLCISTYFTQEFVSNSFYLMIVCLLIGINFSKVRQLNLLNNIA